MNRTGIGRMRTAVAAALFLGGATLTGPYRPATRTNDNVAPVTIQFQGPETGVITLPGGLTAPIRRYRF